MKILRKLVLPNENIENFFLWGQRQTGKSTLLKTAYPHAFWVDLLKAEEFRRYTEHPEQLRLDLKARPSREFVVIDEIQQVPALLNEVHWLIENSEHHFALCGSSARRVKRGQANLLGGRAVKFVLHGFVSEELGDDFDLVRMLNHGTIPRHYLSQQPLRLLNAYVGEYLKEEIASEGLTRNLPAFSEFLSKAALSDTEIVNFSNFAAECGVSPPTIKGYYEILVDTLLGQWLPAYRKRPKRKTQAAPKFYFSDVGVVNFLAKRGNLSSGSELYGKAFENWLYHELSAYNDYQERFAQFSYWKLSDRAAEVDFIINDCQVAIEAKATAKIRSQHLKGLRTLAEEYSSIRRVIVCLEPKAFVTNDGIEVMPYREFTRLLWQGDFF